jgi:hypothetical protein
VTTPLGLNSIVGSYTHLILCFSVPADYLETPTGAAAAIGPIVAAYVALESGSGGFGMMIISNKMSSPSTCHIDY